MESGTKKWILGVILAIHVILVLVNINQPFQGDEIVFPACAKGLIENGQPITALSQFRPEYNCLWHPPFYVNLMAFVIRVFGDGVYAIRGISALFNFLSALLVFFTVSKLLERKEYRDEAALLATGIYALNPLVIQSSVAVDIDGGILNFFTYLFLFFYVQRKNFYWLVPALFVVFWCKFSGPIMLFLGLMIANLILSDLKEIWRVIKLYLITGVAFLASFWIYAAVFDVDFFMPFVHNFAGRSGGFFSYLGIIKAAWAFKSFFYFAVPFLIFLFILLTITYFYTIWNRKWFSRTDNTLLYYNVMAIVIMLFYTYQKGTSWGFPKYFIAAMLPISVFIGSYIFSNDNIWPSLREKIFDKKNMHLMVIVGLILLIFFSFAIGDPLIPEFDETKENADFAVSALLILKSFALYVIVPLVLALIAFWDRRNMTVHSIIFVLLFLTAFSYVYIDSVQAFAGYSTYSRYGDSGVKETITYLDEKNISAEQIATYLNIGYYTDIEKFWDITIDFNYPEQFKKNIVQNEKIDYIIIFNRDINRIGENLKYFELEKQIGGYYIYKKIPARVNLESA